MLKSLMFKQKIPLGGSGHILEKRVCCLTRQLLVNGPQAGSIMYPLDLMLIMKLIIKKMAGHGIPKAQDLMD